MSDPDNGHPIGERELKRYEAILGTIDDAVFVVDQQRTVEYATESALERADTTLDELRGTPVGVLVDRMVGEGGDRFEAAIETVFADDGEFPRRVELELDPPTERGVVEYRLSPEYDDRGEVVSAVVVARDVTDRAQQEKHLERRDEQLTRLHGATRDLLDADSPEHVAEIASDAADDILDLPVNGIHFHDDATDELVPVAVSEGARELLEGVPAIDDGIAWEAFEDGEFRLYEDVREEQDVYNPETPVRSEMYLPLGDAGVFIVSASEVDAFDDIDVDLARTLAANTEAALDRITQEGKLRTREAKLVQQNKRLDDFASVVSHDLRNPLNVAKGRVELAREDCDSQHLDAVMSAHERMDALIDDLLTLAQEGDSVDDVEPVRLREVLEGCWQNVPTADATRVVETDQTIRADRSRLQQLVENLIRNAVEHGGADVTVTVGALSEGFYVADDGPGIPEDEADTVFDVGHSTAEGGNGFGLSIVEEIADAHGWEIAVTESEAGGARFEITGVALEGE